jgi:heptosyltransferase-2/heptosyltransferase-3
VPFPHPFVVAPGEIVAPHARGGRRRRLGGARERFLLTSRRAPYWFNRSQWQLVDWLRRRPAGPVFVFEPDEKPLWLLRRAGIDPAWICTLRDFPRLPGEHIVAHSLRLARATPEALRDTPSAATPGSTPDTRPQLTAADEQDCAAWTESRGLQNASLVLLQPGNKKTMKRGDRRRASNVAYWSEANWAAVIRGVRAALPSARVVICGAPAEREIADDIIALVPEERDAIVNGSGELPISRLLALQARAHSMISVDTGPAHAAAAMGCPLVVMFTRHAHRSPALYAPLPTSAPVEVVQTPASLGDAPLSTITPEAVLATWRERIIGASATPQR